MKRIFILFLALVMLLGAFPTTALCVHAMETEESIAEETEAVEIPTAIEETVPEQEITELKTEPVEDTDLPLAFTVLEKTAAQSELEATIEKQIRAFAKSLNRKAADGDAAWELAKHGIGGWGKKLTVGKSHPLTATLMNAELSLRRLIGGCTNAIDMMQKLAQPVAYTNGACLWGDDEKHTYVEIYSGDSKIKNKLIMSVSNGLDPTNAEANAYDDSMVWMGGIVAVSTLIERKSVTKESVTYDIKVVFWDRFDFSGNNGSVSADLASLFGSVLFREFDWTAEVKFQLTVPNTCTHQTENYHWVYDEEKNSVISNPVAGFKDNPTTQLKSSNTYYKLDNSVKLLHMRPWVLEYTVKNPSYFALSATDMRRNSYPYLYNYLRSYLAVAEYHGTVDGKSNIDYYGLSLSKKFTYNAKDIYRFHLENVVSSDKSNMIYLTVYNETKQLTVLESIPMSEHYKNGWNLCDDSSSRISGMDFIITYLGNNPYPLKPGYFEMMVWENGQNSDAEKYFISKTNSPTCDKKGYTTHTCAACGYSYKDTYVDAPGHTWDDGVVTKEPTEETAGVLTYTCLTCGETKAEELPTLEHTHRYEETVTAPTCTGQGYTTYTCSCGDSYVDAYVEALGHDLSDWKEIVAPTCTQKGSERRACTNCDYSEEQDLKATGHHYQSTDIAPTFTKQGYTEYVCSNCDDRYVEEESYTDPLGLPKPVVKAAQNKQTGGGILTWEADREADSYKIYRATSSKGKYSLYKTVTEPTATVSVPVGKTYCFKVKAICEEDSTLSSPYSSIVKVTGKCARPKVTVSNNTSGYPVIKWSKVTSAKKYWVYRATSENGKYTRVTITTKLSYTDTKATTGKTYFYKVKAIASKSTYNGAYSEIVSGIKKLAKPSITVTLNNDTGTAKITWKKITGAKNYELQYKVNNGEYVTIEGITGISYTQKNLEVGSSYTYRLRALSSNEAMTSAYSAEKKVTVKCGKPVLQGATDSATGKPVLSWDAVDGAESYEIQMATSSKGKYKKLTVVTDTTYTHTAAVGAKTYYYKVRAIDANGVAGADSTVKSIACDCAAPKNVVVSTNSSGYPTVKWGKVSGAKKYEVWYSTAKDGKYTKLTTTSSTSYTYAKAKMDTEYFFKIRAYGSSTTSMSTYSEIVCGIRKLAKPSITLTTSQTKRTVTVKWKKITGASGYELQCKVNSGEYMTIVVIEKPTVLRFVHKDREPGNKYTYRLRAISTNEAISSDYCTSQSATIKVGKPTLSIKLENGKPSLTWTEVESAVKYQVYYATSKSGKYKLVKTTVDLNYIYTAAKKGKTYYFKVRAVDQNGTAGDYSTVKSIKSK